MVLLVVDTQKGIVDERLYAFEKFVRYSNSPLSFLNALHTVLTNRFSVSSGANPE